MGCPAVGGGPISFDFYLNEGYTGDAHIWSDMYAYCEVTRRGTAQVGQRNFCCGNGNTCTPTSCVKPTKWVSGNRCASQADANATCTAMGQRLCGTTDLIDLNIMRSCYHKVWIADSSDTLCARSYRSFGCGGNNAVPDPLDWYCFGKSSQGAARDIEIGAGALCCDDDVSALTASNMS
jgi:hypothetical protein